MFGQKWGKKAFRDVTEFTSRVYIGKVHNSRLGDWGFLRGLVFSPSNREGATNFA